MTLEEELPRLFGELANDHCVGTAPIIDTASGVGDVSQPRSALTLGLAAAACVALLVGGLVVFSDQNSESDLADQPADPKSTTTSPPDGPSATTPASVVLLAPPADSDMTVREGSVQLWSSSAEVSGAVVAPDGTVFTISALPGPTAWLPTTTGWEAIPVDQRAVDTVAGREVAAVIDSSAPGQIYRAVYDDCWNITVTTADAPMWTPDFVTLLDAMSTNAGVEQDQGPAVTVEVPDGWTSLGGGAAPAGWDMEFVVEVDGAIHSVFLTQRPDAPVGVMLYGESNPVPFDHAGRQWWAIDVVTTPSRHTVVGETDFGAFRITSDLSTDQLAAIVDELVPTTADQLPRTMNDPISTTPQLMGEANDVMPPATDPSAAGQSTGSGTCGSFGNGLSLIES